MTFGCFFWNFNHLQWTCHTRCWNEPLIPQGVQGSRRVTQIHPDMSEDDAGDNVLYMCHWRPFLSNAPGPPAVAGTEDLQIVVALAFMSVLHQNWMHTSPQRPLGNQKMLTPHCREAEETSAQGYSAQVSAPCTQPARTALGNEPARGFLLLHSQRPLPKDTSVWWRDRQLIEATTEERRYDETIWTETR